MSSITVPEMIEGSLLIAGESRGFAGREVHEMKSPANGEVFARIPMATEADIEDALAGAYKAYKDWSAKSAYERETIIRAATQHVRSQADEIGLRMALEQGKPYNQSRGEIIASCDTLDYFAAEGVRVEGYTNPTEKPAFRSWVIYQAVGVCALITPWNYPVSLLSWKLGAALAAGCTAVIKPSMVTPLSPAGFCQALCEGGIPAGVISVLYGRGSVLGEKLVRDKRVAKVGMTGSTATGKRLMEVFGPTLGKISLELGGHCPAVVCADADAEEAAEVIAYKGFRNMGQSCSSVNRVYVHESLHDEVVRRVKEKGEAMTMGNGIDDPSVYLGPMATASGLKAVEAHVQDAIAKGATLVSGGKRPEGEEFARGNYYLPTVLTGATREMLCMREETFGPVVPFAAPFTDLDAAIAAANDTDYGLVSYLFTKDLTTAIEASEKLEAGSVCINNGAVNSNYGPYAGWKDSGVGMDLSRKSIFEYLKTKHVKLKLG